MPVHPSVAAALLTWATATDNRAVTETAAIAWAAALDDRVTVADGRAAIDAHRGVSDAWLMPSHVNAGVKAVRDARLRDMRSPEPPAELANDVQRETAWVRAYRGAIGDGLDVERADAAADAAVDLTRAPAVEASPRPAIKLQAHGYRCTCGCLTRPIRRGEGDAA